MPTLTQRWPGAERITRDAGERHIGGYHGRWRCLSNSHQRNVPIIRADEQLGAGYCAGAGIVSRLSTVMPRMS
jgi:hypothetical protein